MIYLVSNSNLLLIWGCNSATILMEEIIMIRIAFHQMFIEWGCTSVEMFFNSYVEESDCASPIKIMAS